MVDILDDSQNSTLQNDNAVEGNSAPSDSQIDGAQIPIADRDENPEDLEMRWIRVKCLKCGYTYEGTESLEKCPKCGNEDPDMFD